MKLEHIAFNVADPTADKERPVDETHTDVVMMRDSWGHALQLCRRKIPMLGK